MSVHLESPPEAAPLSDSIFISYSRQDAAWVNEYLIRQLTAAGVAYEIDESDFEIGEDLKESIQKSLAGCRYTLLVMTPDWVKGKWGNYELMLAVDSCSNADERRIIPLKLKDCDIPSLLADRLYLDLCDIDRRDERMVKLLRQIGVPDVGIAKAQLSVAKKTLQLLIELMDEPKVREQVSTFQSSFEQIEQRNHVVENNKNLHDELQEIQQMLKMVSRDSKRLLLPNADWSDARASMAALRRQIKLLLVFVSTVQLDKAELAFVVPFMHLADDIHSAFMSGDAARYAMMVAEVCNEVDINLPIINDRIVQNVKERPLEVLVESLQSIYERVAAFDFDQPAAEILSRYRAGIDALVDLDQTILRMIADHAVLQQVEVRLHLMCKSGDPTYYRISVGWRLVDSVMMQLKLVDRYGALLSSRGELNALLSDESVIRDDHFEQRVKLAFATFVEEANFAFNVLDINLLDLCRQLVPHGDELRKILRMMQSHDKEI